jgi:hypothetical protein
MLSVCSFSGIRFLEPQIVLDFLRILPQANALGYNLWSFQKFYLPGNEFPTRSMGIRP